MICPSCHTEGDETADRCSQCGQDLFSLSPGHVLSGRYEIAERLGRGGMGVVYRARDRELDVDVAIKTLRTDLAGSTEVTRRFRDEIKLARTISHPNVCRIHEYGKDGELAYIVMELVEGVDLKHVLQDGGPLPADVAYDVAIQVAEALQVIHEGGVVHRDLKTANIMQDERGAVKVMDFGIAKRFESAPARPGERLTATGQIVGTAEYMSPEQALAQELDVRSDVYSLGVVVFELFTGDVPFRAETFMATAYRHVRDPLPWDAPQAHLVPEPLVPVLEKAMSKARDARYASAREMAEALRAARAATAFAAPRPKRRRGYAPTARVQTSSARSRLLLAGAALAVALGVAVALLRPGGPAPVERATTPVVATPSAPATEVPATPLPTAETAPPSPARLARRATVPPAAARLALAPASPAPTATAIPTEAPTEPPTAAPETPRPVEEKAKVQLAIKPWAEVTVDDRPAGTSPLPVLSLPPGPHVFQFRHPYYQPIVRRVTLRPGQTLRLAVDFDLTGIPKQR
jgi:serine/threonine-protein kinase